MEAEFIPYELALALKELGFDEPCFGQYSDKALCQHVYGKVRQGNLFSYNCIASLYQQAFRWFRKKYGLCSWVYQSNTELYHYSILKDGRFLSGAYLNFETYEEAELECLKKLIEIVKQNNNE